MQTVNQFLRENNMLPVKERSMNFPEKIFIERDGPGYEYSETAPGGLDFKVQNVLNGYYGAQNYIELFYSLPEIFAPVHEIAKRVSDANWQLRKEWNDEIEYKDSDFNRLFSQPNPLESFKDMVYQSVCYEILTGKLLWFFNKSSALSDDYKNIFTWSALPSQSVTIEMKKGFDPYTATSINDYVSSYKLSISRGDETGVRVFPPEKILPLLNLSLNGSGYDLNQVKPYLCGADKAIRNLIPVYEARGMIYIKRGAMGLWVSKKTDQSGNIAMTPGEQKQAADQINADFGITGNRRTIGVAQAPMDFIKTGMSISELEPFTETRADAIAIYSCLRVPRHLMPNEDSTNYDNASTDMASFYSNVIEPWGQRYAQSWTNYMNLKDVRKYIYADFSHVVELKENKKDKASYENVEGNTYLLRFQSGVSTLNDWIVAIGDKPVANNDLYKLRIGEMTPDQLEQVKAIINLKTPVKPENDAGTKN